MLGTLGLPPEALRAHVITDIINPLISLGQLTDSGCHAYLTPRRAYIIYQGKVILTGYRKRQGGLWRINLQDKSKVLFPGMSTLDNKQWRHRNSSHSCNALIPHYTTA